ncbi:bifunctional DedA family/phosphatase PAP2 family protein [Pseudomonas citronellolis]|uniref:bifunctional DedA family/phosphatase PAP2 family protein n=1 Tax=Pseudomonas citronellolis TaxID=53408 RepID=UPI00209CDB45|nr:bifunctional DedA family/phosphatase PAP2 family protein [Pseudomonas citronellolis]MCP1602593.1 undecaprenyl-diphosphatase [Pseudomonas citronellolis]MCP1653651.1 undecaprenyl-diphosphatase [Pseudomonas citronellolis]MCP1720596.1 undecaprenyl-diphosphatase [Pseudomonas citronellolis]
MSLDLFNQWIAGHPQWLGLVVFLIAFLECAAVVGLVLPGVVMLFAVAVLAGGGALGLGQTLLLAFAGGLLGDLCSYFLGRRFHQDIRRLPLLRHHPEWLAGAEGFVARYGVTSLLVGRFIGALRPFLPLVAGMLDMPFGRFLAVSILAATGWSVAYLLPGWTTGAALRLPLPEGFWPEMAVVAGGLAVLGGALIHACLKRRHGTALIAAGLSAALLLGILIGWPHLDALDHGLMTLIQEERSPLLNHIMVAVTRLGDFRTQVIVGIVVSGLLLGLGKWRHALFAGGTLLATALLNTTLKHFFGRARPEVIADPLSAFSMPSGHSSASFACFLVLGVLASREGSPRVRLTWLLLAMLPAAWIAGSRLYLGAHWPSDVIAGALLAAAVCAAALWASQLRQPLPALPKRIWWCLVPTLLLVFSVSVGWDLSHAVARYTPL